MLGCHEVKILEAEVYLNQNKIYMVYLKKKTVFLLAKNCIFLFGIIIQKSLRADIN